MSTVEFLQGELERLFELDKMKTLSSELLGFDPTEVGGTAAKATFARALAKHCEDNQGLAALEDAIRFSSKSGPVQAAPRGEEQELSPGNLVGGFKVLKRLAEGPLGSVYLAERPAPSNGHTERAALKIFHRASTRDRAAALRLLTAARALKQVQDIGLAGIYEAGTLPDGRLFLASEYIPGQTLAARLSRSGPVHFGEVRAVARTLLKGLAALHKRGFLHGHLKAENVFLVRQQGSDSERTEPYGVLADLGVGRLLVGGESAPPGVLRLVGEPSIMAPEVARGVAPDARSEVYAMGCLLYQALTGKPVFEAESAIEQITAHLYEEPAPLSERAPSGWVSSELEAVITRALSKEPAERYESARDFADALEDVARNTFTEAEAPALDMQELLAAIAAFQANPSDEALAAQLEAMVAPSRSWHHVIDVFLEAADAVDEGPIKRKLLFRTARVLADETKDAEAAERVYRVVLEYDPSDAQAHNAIEELRRASGDHEGLVGLLLDRLESETANHVRGSILREVATLYEEELEAEENAFVAWIQALAEDPDDARSARAIERLAKTPEQWLEAI
jgi:serine/threonine protein kinase